MVRDDAQPTSPPRRLDGNGLLFVVATLVALGLAVAAFVVPALLVPLSVVPYGLATAGAALAFRAFRRGERMRWAWLFAGLGHFIGGATCALLHRPPLHVWAAQLDSDALNSIGLVGDLFLNVFSVLGLVMLAQAWRSLGPSPHWYRVATAIAFAVGALAVGPSLGRLVPQVLAGVNYDAWSSLISSAGDLTAITMIGPLAVTAIIMRGGALVWVYRLLTLSALSWLFFDAAGLLEGGPQELADLVFSSLGMAYLGAAGAAHWRVVRWGS
jgi:hypothetical protein